MILSYTYVDDNLDNAEFSFSGDVKKMIDDYFDEAKYFGPNDCPVKECSLDGKDILPKSGWTIEEMMDSVISRIGYRVKEL